MTRRLSKATPAAHRRSTRHPRSGFSMIELLIVITVIAILISLLLVGVQAAVSRARVAQVVAEMKNLEAAIRQFEAEFGIQPPSFVLLHEFAGPNTGWNSPDAETRTSRATLKQMFPSIDFAQPMDFDGDSASDKSFRLNGAQCLVFFLGGMMTVDNSTTPPTYTPKGFSKVPSRPFQVTTATGYGPYYEFNAKQIQPVSESLPVYYDAIPGQRNPIQYFSSYGGQGYRPYGRDGNLSTTNDNEVFDSLLWVYTRSNGQSATSPGEPHNPRTFQLISPGFDGEYGVGGLVDPESGVKDGTLYLPAGHNPATVDRAAPNTQYERDNIVNFLSAELH